MSLINAYLALEETAKREGVSVEHILFEIDKTIVSAISSAIRNNNTEAINGWNKIPCEGPIPTALEFLSYLQEKSASDAEKANGKPLN